MTTIRSFHRRLRHEHGEEGSALVLALLVVLLVGSLLAGALRYADAGLGLAPTIKAERNRTNYVQGAVEGAINNLRGSKVFGRVGQTCPPFKLPSGLPNTTDTVRVTCEGVSTGSASAETQPEWAIQALGNYPEGIRQVGGNANLTIDGGVYSRGVLTVAGGAQNQMTVIGTAIAEGSGSGASDVVCSGKVVSTDPGEVPICRTTDPALMALGADPLYKSAVASLSVATALGVDPVPTCSTTSGLVIFGEGYYSERPDLLARKADCDGSVYWFPPGRYVFGYPGVWDLGTPAAVNVIAGTPGTGFAAATLGSSCDATLASGAIPTQPGAQFIFSGTSQLKVSVGGSLEVCGPRTGQSGFTSLTGAARYVGIYGIHSASDGRSVPATVSDAELTATTGPTSPSNRFSFANRARTADGSSAVAALATSATASLEYSAASLPDVPEGARVTSVKVRVRHTSLYTSSTIAPSTPGNTAGGATPSPISVPATCNPCDLTVPIEYLTPRAAGTSDPAAAVWRDVNSMSLSYVTTGGNIPGGLGLTAGTETVDAVQVVVTYDQPGLHPQICSSCNFFDSSTNPSVIIRGTVYTPDASWAARIHNTGQTIFNRGVVLRHADLNMSASSTQESAPFQLPVGNPVPRRVLFKAYINSETVPRLRACVDFDDTAPTGSATAALYGYRVDVRRWNYQRVPGDGNSCTGVP